MAPPAKTPLAPALAHQILSPGTRSRLTVILPSSSLSLALSFFQDTEGSGWPRGGTHSITAGSPTATSTFPGDCRKSSRRTGGGGGADRDKERMRMNDQGNK